MKPIDRTEAERLVQTYSDMILRLSYTYLKSTQDAEDICQTVFLKLLTGGMVFDSPEHEKGLGSPHGGERLQGCAPRRSPAVRGTGGGRGGRRSRAARLRRARRRDGAARKIPRSSVPVLLRRLFRARGRRPARQERGRGLRPSQPRPEKSLRQTLGGEFYEQRV